MKAEEFDQYVRAQFENETVAPRAEVEDAVFASLNAATRKRRGIAAAAILLVATSATALWLHAPAQPDAPDPAPTEADVPVAVTPIISPEQPSEAVAPVAPTTSDEPDGTGPEPRKTQAIGQHATSAPVALDEVAARGLSGVELQETSEPQLQQLEGEKWVLPATIKVKD